MIPERQLFPLPPSPQIEYVDPLAELEKDPYNPESWTFEAIDELGKDLEIELDKTLCQKDPSEEQQENLAMLTQMVCLSQSPKTLDAWKFELSLPTATLPAVALKRFIEAEPPFPEKELLLEGLRNFILVGTLSNIVDSQPNLSQECVAQLSARILALAMNRLLLAGSTMLPLGWVYTDPTTHKKVGHLCIAVFQQMPKKPDLYRLRLAEGTKSLFHRPVSKEDLWEQDAFVKKVGMTIEDVKNYLRVAFSYMFETLRPSFDKHEVQEAIYEGTSLSKRATRIRVPDYYACTVEGLRAALYAMDISDIERLFMHFRLNVFEYGQTAIQRSLPDGTKRITLISQFLKEEAQRH
jgi:hypothetical protein